MVLHVDSPGGSVAGGEDLHDAGDLVLPPHERIDALGEGLLVEVHRVGLEGVLRGLRPVALGELSVALATLLFGALRDAVRDVRDDVEPRHPRPLE